MAPGSGSTPYRWPAALMVNIGELLELATTAICATVHRVVSPPAQQQRLSIAFFLGAQRRSGAGLYPAARAGA